MKHQPEEDLQRLIESQIGNRWHEPVPVNSPVDQAQADPYRSVFEVLAEPPEYELDEAFANRVAQRALIQPAEPLWAEAIIVPAMTLAGAVASLFVFPAMVFKWLASVSGVLDGFRLDIILVLGGVVGILALMDRQLGRHIQRARMRRDRRLA